MLGGGMMVFLFIGMVPVMAMKPRIWGAVTSTRPTYGGSFSVSARFSDWKQYLTIYFRGMGSTNGATYELIYSGNNTDQGVYGDVKASEGTASRALFLGTCSFGVCTPYKNVGNMHLTITYKTKDGSSVVKKYKVKY